MNNIKPRLIILSLGAGLALALIGSSIAQSTVADILKQTQANLEKSSWQATVFGNFKTNGGTQEAEVAIQVIPGSDATMRMDFQKPTPMAGNFTVLNKKEAWSYLFVSNQLVIEARAGAKLSELAEQISGLSDVNNMDDQFNLKLEGEEQTADGTAWKLSGTPKKSGQRFASVTVLILKRDPRPLSLMLKDSGDKVIGTLNIRNFKRAKLTAKELMKYPSDAAMVSK